MNAAYSTGKKFELQCITLLRRNRMFVRTNPRVPITNSKYYRPDALTESEVFEFKYQQITGSVCNKLTQAVIELQLMAEMLNYKAIMVYEGKELVRFIEHDPAFKRAFVMCPNVSLMSFNTFNEYLTQSSDSNNREPNRLLEHAA